MFFYLLDNKFDNLPHYGKIQNMNKYNTLTNNSVWRD